MMEFKITQKENKPMLSRSECIAEIKAGKTPSYTELKKEIAAETKKEENLIVIKRIDQKFGSDEMKVIFHLYDSEDALKKFNKEKKKKDAAAPAK